MKKLVCVLVGVSSMMMAQKPALEFSRIDGDGNPTGNGIALEQLINFNLDKTNTSSSNNSFAVYNGANGKLSATFKVTNSYQGGITRPPTGFGGYNFQNQAMVMGANNSGVDLIYQKQNKGGDSNKANSNYTSASSDAGQGFDNNSNYGIGFCLFTNGLTYVPDASRRERISDIEITFNRPVNDPILHINGLGGKNGSFGFTAEFDVLSGVAGQTITGISKLSGKNNFSVVGNQINNSSKPLGSTGADTNATSGSVKIAGKGLTKIILRTYMRSDAGTVASWGGVSSNTSDGFTIGLSVAESDLQLTTAVNNTAPTIGDIIELTLKVKNQGPSNDNNVLVANILPAGLTFVSSSDSSYSNSTNLWNIATIANGETKTIVIKAKVTSVGSIGFNATMTGGNSDPISNNNISNLSIVANALCQAGTAQVNLSKTTLNNNSTQIVNQLFYEDFGTSDINNGDRGRKPSVYMPSNSFLYGSSYINNGSALYSSGNSGSYWGTDARYNKARLNDGYYAIVAPGLINQGWYGNDSWTSWWNTSVKDYSGTANGAALVLNAGNNLNAFYNREANLQVGAKYRASYQLFIVEGNSPVRVAIDIKSKSDNSVIATYTSDLFTTSQQNVWQPVVLEFTMPGVGADNSCVTRDVIVSLRNDYQENNGNDYYIDDIKIDKILDAPSCPPAEGCVTNGITSVNLNSMYTGAIPSGAQLVWYSTPDHSGNPVSNPQAVTVSGSYYAFFYDATNGCFNTNSSTAMVNVSVYPQCYCTKPGDFSAAGAPTLFGLTTMSKTDNWPKQVTNGHLAMEGRNSGFVITRVSSVSDIQSPRKGMLVYEKDGQCVKLYNGTTWKCIERSCND